MKMPRCLLLTIALAMSFVCAMPALAGTDPPADMVAFAQVDAAPAPAADLPLVTD